MLKQHYVVSFSVTATLLLLKPGADEEEESEPEEPQVEDLSDEDERPPAMEKGERNSLLTVGYKNDHTFVVRGDKIGVFKNGQKVEYSATIRGLGFKSKKAFKPKQVWRISRVRAVC